MIKRSSFSSGRPTGFATSPCTSTSAGAVLRRAVDWGFISVLFIAPLFFGGRYDGGRFVFVALSVTLALAWLSYQIMEGNARRVRTWAHFVCIAALSLVVLQLLPLPSDWIQLLSPRTHDLMPLWHPSEGSSLQLGVWKTLSLAPEETRTSLAVLVAYYLLFVTALGWLRNRADIERLMRWIALAAVAMAVFGVLQFFTSNGKFFWFYDHPYRTTSEVVVGSFANRNHFAHFLVLGMGPLMAWLSRFYGDERAGVGDVRQFPTKRFSGRKSGGERWISTGSLLSAAVALVAFTIILSMSRGGVLACGVALTAIVLVLLSRGLARARHAYWLLAFGVVVVAMLSVHGYERASRRLNSLASLTSGSVEAVDHSRGRRKIWSANLEATSAGLATGAGAGSHRFVYPLYLAESQVRHYSHAENGYLQISTEMGLPGVLLLVAGITFCMVWFAGAWINATAARDIWCLAAILAGISASLAHSLVDYVWYVPACMSVTILLIAALLRLAQLTAEEHGAPAPYQMLPRTRWIELTTVVLLVGGWAVASTFGPAMAATYWTRYLRTSVACDKITSRYLVGAAGEVEAKEADAVRLMTAAMVDDLRTVVRWDPRNGRARLRLAGRYLDQFSIIQRTAANAMSVSQIRNAAIASDFASTAALQQWLQRAFPETAALLYKAAEHAHRAVELIPLQGKGYLYLADLCFLHGRKQAESEALVAQALLVRPYSGDVLFEVGKERLMAGRIEQALQYWQSAYQDTGPHQLRIVQLLAGRLPATQFIEVFRPDWRTFGHVWDRYRSFGQAEDFQPLLTYAANMTASTETTTGERGSEWNWLALGRMQLQANQLETAVASLKKAHIVDTTNFTVRSELALVLLKLHRFAEAEEHLKWCLSRRPEEEHLRQARLLAAKGMMNEPETYVEVTRGDSLPPIR